MAGERWPTRVQGVYSPSDPSTLGGVKAGIAVGEPSLAQGATNGFLWIPTVAAAPTGVPIAVTGYCPICVDITNHRLYIYEAGAWKYTTIAV